MFRTIGERDSTTSLWLTFFCSTTNSRAFVRDTRLSIPTIMDSRTIRIMIMNGVDIKMSFVVVGGSR